MPTKRPTPSNTGVVKRRWRFFATSNGRKPALEFLQELRSQQPVDAAQIAEEMEWVRVKGLRAARKLTRDIYEVRVDGDKVIYRVLFAAEGSKGRVLLAIEVFSKKSQKTPTRVLDLAERRLGEWRRRGHPSH